MKHKDEWLKMYAKKDKPKFQPKDLLEDEDVELDEDYEDVEIEEMGEEQEKGSQNNQDQDSEEDQQEGDFGSDYDEEEKEQSKGQAKSERPEQATVQQKSTQEHAELNEKADKGHEQSKEIEVQIDAKNDIDLGQIKDEKLRLVLTLDKPPDYEKIQFSESIKMKKLNEFGLPADDGYDYYQHIVREDKEGGEIVYSTYEKPK